MNPMNIVGSWQQDRWSNGGSRGLVAGVSFDGGATWANVPIPKITLCSGGTQTNGGDFQRASDPWLSFAPNGDLYHISLSLDISPPANRPGGNGRSALLVSKSTDGGLTWSDPIKLIEDDNPRFLDDKESITADPADANFVYGVWDRLQASVGSVINPENVFGFGFKGPAMLSRTTDGGRTWEAPRIIYDPGANNQTIGNQIVVLPDGTLVDFFNEILNFKNVRGATSVFNLSLIRSTNRGATWTRGQPIRAANILTRAAFDPQGIGVRDPDTNDPLRTGDIIPQVAVDRNMGSPGGGNLYAVWQDSRFSNLAHDSIAFAQSTDGGFTWSRPIQINQTPTNIPSGNQQAFTPAIRVAADGTIGVTYYDFRNNTFDPATLPTDYFIVRCQPTTTTSCTSPENWKETPITSTSFDMRKAPVARGFFVGDYEGLAVVGDQFKPFFVQSGPTTGISNVFSTTVGP
ncbi:MAG TPA: sialidase family protein [Candidatus Methylomirabilis sp.]|nr:sialidase family protein [Candidatus Methylomirabilis sp.]